MSDVYTTINVDVTSDPSQFRPQTGHVEVTYKLKMKTKVLSSINRKVKVDFVAPVCTINQNPNVDGYPAEVKIQIRQTTKNLLRPIWRATDGYSLPGCDTEDPKVISVNSVPYTTFPVT